MGRPRLPDAQRKDAQRTIKMTKDEFDQLEELAKLPNANLAALFEVVVRDATMEQKFDEMNSQSSVVRSLIRHGYRRLQEARNQGLPWADTGKSLPLLTAALRLGVGEERLREIVKLLGIKGRKDRRGYYRYSPAQVEYVRAYLDRGEK